MNDVKLVKSQYSLTRYSFSVIWIFSAFLIAQIADGFKANLGLAMLFCLAMGSVAGKIKSPIALGAYVGFTIMLAHFGFAAYSMTYTSDQFFPSFWGPLDLLLALMMWTSPLIILFADAFDKRISSILAARIFTALAIIKTPFSLEIKSIRVALISRSNKLFDQCELAVNASRAPPLLIK